MALNKKAKGNKVIRKISKSTLNKSVDTVADFTDLFSQMVVEYFNQRYKIEKKLGDVKKGTMNALFGLKKAFIGTIVEATLLITGILALVIGLMMLLSRIVNVDYILLGYGLIITIGVLFKMKVKA